MQALRKTHEMPSLSGQVLWACYISIESPTKRMKKSKLLPEDECHQGFHDPVECVTSEGERLGIVSNNVH